VAAYETACLNIGRTNLMAKIPAITKRI